jgi:hypothetical protein
VIVVAQDRPTASELLSAIADMLRDEAIPALDKADPRLGFQMRVAVNALAILEREARLGPAADVHEHARLATLLRREGSRAGERDERDADLMAHLEATIADKVAIANPKWR